ncbi:MAG TPA: hypothetical protein G4O14_11145 [Anaerolineae bacterium]|nr:hypothetical protein [Anaerolineae bacterium]
MIRSIILILFMLSGFLCSSCTSETIEVPRATFSTSSTSTHEPTQTPMGGGSGNIVFSSYREGESEIFTIDLDGSGMIRLTEDTARLNQPTWSPDGSHIAYVRREWPTNLEIYVMKADGSDQIRLTHNFHAFDIEPDWSPDGSQIAFASSMFGYLDIFTINLDDFQQTRLTENWGVDSSPDWSPNGQQIVYRSEHNENNEIFIMDADGSAKINLTNHPASDTDPAWSHDGSRIAFVSDRNESEDIYVMNADGSNLFRLTNSPAKDTYPAWSPDGRMIAFYSDRSGNFEIYVMEADGSNQIPITDHGDFDGFPDWEPQPSAIQTISIQPLHSVNPEILSWLQQNAFLIPSITPRAGYNDLLPLKEVFEEARFVALGEAALGTVESIRMKHLMVEFLISELGFNKIILAMDWETANQINQSIQANDDDLEQILAALDHASWSTVEMLDLINMLRSYIQFYDSPTRPIIVSGYYNITPDLPMDQVIQFLERIDPASAEIVVNRYSCFRKFYPSWFMYSEIPNEEKEFCSEEVQSVLDYLRSQRSVYESSFTPEYYSYVLLSAQLVANFEEQYRVEDPWLRESRSRRNTAESIRWLGEQGGNDDKVILLGDNFTIADYDPSFSTGNLASQGHHLQDYYGKAMVAIGFAFHSGGVNARNFGMGSPIMVQQVQPASEGSFEWVAHNLGWPAFMLDLREIDLEQLGAVWLDQPLYLHSIGEFYRRSDPETYFFQYHLPTAFDAILYIDEVTPSHLLPSSDD